MKGDAPPTVLVVEDYADTREGLRRVLKLAGYEVGVAADGQEAIDYLNNNPAPALIVLDMLMPVLDGWHFLEQLDALDMRPRPHILVVTAVPAISQEWAKAHGCDGCLHEPVSMPDLLAQIRRALERPVNYNA